MSARNYYKIAPAEMIAFLEARKFSRIQLPDTKEIVFSKRYDWTLRNDAGELTLDIPPLPLSVRVFTSCTLNGARDVGEDAIRVSVVMQKVISTAHTSRGSGRLFTEQETRIVGVGSSKRVHRIETWEKNLAQRLDNWQDMLQPLCPRCGAPMRFLVPRQGEKWHPFFSCCRYPDCKGTRKENE